jgi:hypothetical protein
VVIFFGLRLELLLAADFATAGLGYGSDYPTVNHERPRITGFSVWRYVWAAIFAKGCDDAAREGTFVQACRRQLFCLLRTSHASKLHPNTYIAVLLVAAKSKQASTWTVVVSLLVAWLQMMAFSFSTARIWREAASGVPEGT